MNSALQCLVHTVPLTSYFLSKKWEKELNTTNPLGMEGQIPKAYAELVSNLWYKDSSPHYAPRSFKYTIGERNPTFVGYGQQDSHELLQSLLDGLHEDLNRILKKEYIEDPEWKGMSEDEFAKLSWDVYRKRNDSIIVDLFQSQLKSRTECQQCGHTSIKFDPYMYLQLPIPESKTTDVIVYTLPLDRGEPAMQLKPTRIKVTVPRHCPINEMKLAVAKKLNWSIEAQQDPDRSICVELFSNKIHRYLGKLETIGDMAPEDIICVVEAGQPSKFFTESSKIAYPELHLPVMFQLAGPTVHSSFAFGFPLFVTVPETVVQDRLMTEEEMLRWVGSCCYRQIVSNLRRFTAIPLFRRVGSDITITETLRRKQEKIAPFINTKDISWNVDDADWEPIPDLFTLSIQEGSRYSFKRSETQIYPIQIDTRESTPENSALDVDDNQLPSPKSDLSDLANRLNERSLEDSQKAQSESSSKRFVKEFTFQREYQFVMGWNREAANFLFGKHSVPEGNYSSMATNSVFHVYQTHVACG
jgi:hypothetical protein